MTTPIHKPTHPPPFFLDCVLKAAIELLHNCFLEMTHTQFSIPPTNPTSSIFQTPPPPPKWEKGKDLNQIWIKKKKILISLWRQQIGKIQDTNYK